MWKSSLNENNEKFGRIEILLLIRVSKNQLKTIAMSETLDQDVQSTGQRPTFLTVLCILTFIGSGLGVLGGLLALIGSSALSSFAPSGSIAGAAIGLVSAGLCLFGAIKMWGLYKQGFMLYVAGSVLALIGGVVNILSVDTSGLAGYGSMQSQMQSAMWMSFAFSAVIILAFVLMYNANKKHLVK